MKGKIALFLFVCLAGLTGCTDHALLDENQPIKNSTWSNKQVREFTATVKDADIPYHVYLNIRNSMEYSFSNLSVLLRQISPDKTTKTYRVKVVMADKEGLWIGKGAGNLYAQQVRFLKNHHFPDTGVYTFRIEHNMRLDPLMGITDIGLRVAPVGGY